MSSGLSSEQAHKNFTSNEVGWVVRTIHLKISISFLGILQQWLSSRLNFSTKDDKLFERSALMVDVLLDLSTLMVDVLLDHSVMMVDALNTLSLWSEHFAMMVD